MHEAQGRPSQRLLGSGAPPGSDNELSWTSTLKLDDDPWLSDQILFGSKTFPIAGYIAIAGECVRQLSPESECFSLKDFSISSALVFNSDDKLEIRTRLRPQGLDEDERQWHEIEITLQNGDQSIGLCTGLVSLETIADSGLPQDATRPGDVLKSVSSDYWYDMIADRGIKYGASQQGLGDILVHLTEGKASATIVPVLEKTDSVAHPVFIDHCLQVLMIAACKGQGRLLSDLFVVTSIEHLVVSNNAWSRLTVSAAVEPGQLQNSTCNFSAVNENGLTILSGRCTITSFSDFGRQSDRKLFSFLNWNTDSTNHNLNQFLTSFQSELDSTVVLERLALLYALRCEDVGVPSQTYSKRILKMIGTKRKGRFGLIPDVSPFAECEPSSRTKLIELLKDQLSGTELAPFGVALEECLIDNTPFSGSESERKLLLDQLNPFIRNSGTLTESLRLIGHKNPKLKVLEIGSGTISTTQQVLKALRTQFDEPLYSSYLSTSASSDAITNMKENLGGHSNVQALLFNAEKGIEEQGLKAGIYDLVIITNFAALMSNAKTGAKTIKQLVHPQGNVVLLEGVPEPEWLSVLKDYLTKESPNSPNEAKSKSSFGDVYAAMTENGFEFDDQDNKSTSTPKVFAKLKQAASQIGSEVTIVGPAYHLPLIREVEKTFGDHKIKCVKCTMEDDISPSRDMMVFVDFDEPYLYNITEGELSKFVKLVSGMKSKMIWVTPSAQISCKNPNTSMILGLMRTMRSEFKKNITMVELDPKRTMNVSLSKSLLKIYEGLGRRVKSKDLDHDYEYAIVDGEIKVPRIQWTTAEAEYANLAAYSAEHGIRSHSSSPGTATVSGTVQFRPDRCYLLVGGLGGLGRMISTWMVENGARNIIFFSRSAKEGPETTPFFDELRAQGCTITPFAGSVTHLPDVEEVVKQAMVPIAGVIQMSAVMRDNLMSQMTFSEWQTSVQPKVQGTWNLHHATSSADLDFFLLFSSICGVTGQWGQGNYNAANSFLDAFVNYRHGQNLPASVVDIGFMGSIGMAVESEALMKNLKGSGYYFLNERHLIDALTISLAHSRPAGDRLLKRSQLGLGIRSTKAMATPACRVAWKKDSRMAISHHFEPIGGVGDQDVKNLLNRAYSTQKA